ncbi:Hypothetical protein SRAE_0000003400 [Strongyloides ratti]|uniref:DUF19 domain-containing protein n=1 Tax=Strongyloides ratti TaxID=34506 RepID=A0A090KYE3_STRRB|nr:Hypothetical protein SRAE_0000003400 [Strongyloides ratti]CEF60902.1 Hypothetical protein SRAE_0000003400 [Strongyloides ratti]
MIHFTKLFTLLTAAGATSICNSSSYSVVTSCYTSFLNFYNLTISSSMMFPKYKTFLEARRNYEIIGSIDKLKETCTIQNSLTSCLGSSVSCVNSEDLLKIFKFNKSDNEEYTGDYYMSNYKCTTGYQFLLNNFNCLVTTEVFGIDKIKECSTNFENSLKSKGCEAGNDLISCLSGVYSSFCGPKAADFVCNLAKIDMTYDMPECNGKFVKCNPL